MKISQKPQETSGHRARVRKKFIKSIGQELHEYELLEILLFAANPRQDTKSLAKNLMKKFGDISGVVNSEIDILKDIDGVGEAAIVQIKVVAEIIKRILKNNVRVKAVLNNWQAVLEYSQVALKDLSYEVFRVLFLDKKHQLIEDELLGLGDVDAVSVNPKMIVKKALLLSASSVILMHNHPSGDLRASAADIKVTNDIMVLMKGLDIEVLDHLIISSEGYFSFREGGLI